MANDSMRVNAKSGDAQREPGAEAAPITAGTLAQSAKPQSGRHGDDSPRRR